MDHILIIEDDADIREAVRILLNGEGFFVEEAANGTDGLKKIDNGTNLVILDVMLPGISGLKVCEEIRTFSYVPILFLTAKSTESDKLIGLTSGGDDYLIKPFSYSELLARIKALLRRHQIYDKETLKTAKDTEWLENHSIRIHTSHNAVFLDGREISLTDREYRILLLLMSYPAKIFSIQNLYESIWEEPFFHINANTVMVHIRNLRTKIEANPQEPRIIQTVWGKGYRLG